jgi:hypothetical protein
MRGKKKESIVKMQNGQCIIGMQKPAMIPLMGFIQVVLPNGSGPSIRAPRGHWPRLPGN